jgi:C-terminal processing protease CtpA/Prc
METPRAVIGVGTTSGTTSRDTLGVLVSTVRAGSPAEKAGIEEGNRIASVNGLNLRLSAADIGDDQMGGIMSRRLSRELDKLRPGDEVDLRVYAGSQWKTLKVKTVPPEDLYATSRATVSRRADERATLGINLAVTGSPRDTIGVFVMSVEEVVRRRRPGSKREAALRQSTVSTCAARRRATKTTTTCGHQTSVASSVK